MQASGWIRSPSEDSDQQYGVCCSSQQGFEVSTGQIIFPTITQKTMQDWQKEVKAQEAMITANCRNVANPIVPTIGSTAAQTEYYESLTFNSVDTLMGSPCAEQLAPLGYKQSSHEEILQKSSI